MAREPQLALADFNPKGNDQSEGFYAPPKIQIAASLMNEISAKVEWGTVFPKTDAQ